MGRIIQYNDDKHIENREAVRRSRAARRNLVATECAICGSSVSLVIDHDHTTGVNRGWLCNNCNVGIGMFRDDAKLLTIAAAYLLRHA